MPTISIQEALKMFLAQQGQGGMEQPQGIQSAVPLQDDPGSPFNQSNQAPKGENSVSADLERRFTSRGSNPQRQPVTPGSRVPLPKRDYSPDNQEQMRNNRLGFAYDKLGVVENLDTQPWQMSTNNYLERAEDIMFRANQLRQRAMMNRLNQAGGQGFQGFQGGGGGGGGMGAPKGKFGAFVKAISGKESGGNYGAVNPHSGALGKYQIMPGNFAGSGGWDREALGRDITTSQFLHSPRLQEQIARHKLRQYYSRYGVRGAASAWYSGDPNKWRNKSPQGGYPSIHAYVMSILNAMGL